MGDDSQVLWHPQSWGNIACNRMYTFKIPDSHGRIACLDPTLRIYNVL